MLYQRSALAHAVKAADDDYCSRDDAASCGPTRRSTAFSAMPLKATFVGRRMNGRMGIAAARSARRHQRPPTVGAAEQAISSEPATSRMTMILRVRHFSMPPLIYTDGRPLYTDDMPCRLQLLLTATIVDISQMRAMSWPHAPIDAARAFQRHVPSLHFSIVARQMI